MELANPPSLELRYGRKDLLTTLDETREKIIAGELDAIAIIAITKDGQHEFNTSWIDDMPFYWARIVAAVHDFEFHLHHDGLEDQL